MIHITFCYETDLDLTYMKNEITKCFEQRGAEMRDERPHRQAHSHRQAAGNAG